MNYFLKAIKNFLTYSLIILIVISIFGFNFFISFIGNILLLLFLIPLLLLFSLFGFKFFISFLGNIFLLLFLIPLLLFLIGLLGFNSFKSKINTCSNCGAISLGLSQTCMNCGTNLENINNNNLFDKNPGESTIEVNAEEVK